MSRRYEAQRVSEPVSGLQLAGWKGAYIEWEAAHGDDVGVFAHAVPSVALQELIHRMAESALRAGREARDRAEPRGSRT